MLWNLIFRDYFLSFANIALFDTTAIGAWSFKHFNNKNLKIFSFFTAYSTYSAVVESLSRVRLCDPMDCSMPGFPVLHHLLEFVHIHVH